MTREELLVFMACHKLAVVSSIGRNGSPQSALIGIAVTGELEIVFDTVKSSRKYGNLIANPAAALVLGWTGESTLQFEGMARELSGEELGRYKEVYFAAWPECVSHQQWADICYFAVKPNWMRFSDYGVTPAVTEEFHFE
jgi:pyridoxine/pyridoxamine 5'-phosphate oxidase